MPGYGWAVHLNDGCPGAEPALCGYLQILITKDIDNLTLTEFSMHVQNPTGLVTSPPQVGYRLVVTRRADNVELYNTQFIHDIPSGEGEEIHTPITGIVDEDVTVLIAVTSSTYVEGVTQPGHEWMYISDIVMCG